MEDTVHTPPQTALSNVSHEIDIMVDEVASLIGQPKDPAGRTRAMKALDRAASWLNMSGVFMYARKTKTYDTFNDGQTTLEIPSDFGWPEDRPRVYGDDQLYRVLEWLDWDAFNREKGQGDTSRPSIPTWISLRSELDTNFEVWPSINSSDVSRIELDYFTRISQVTGVDSSAMVMTPETREAMICGGQAFVTQMRYLRSPRVWQPMMNLFFKAATNAKASAWRYRQVVHSNARPDESGWVQTPPFSSTVRGGTAFIAI